MSEYLKLLQNKNFVYLWVSQLLSQFTVNMMNFLLLTRLFLITGSSIATSLLWVTFALPAIFFGPIGAASVDLVSKRKMLMATNLLQALSVFTFFFYQQQSVFMLYIVVLAYSFFNQFYVPAESASLPSLVSKKDFTAANSLFFITQQAALIAGFGLGGIFQKFLGFNGSLILCSVFLFIAFVSVTFLPKLEASKKLSTDFEEIIKSFFNSIAEGYEFIKSHKNILFPLGILLMLQIYLAITTAHLPVLGSQILKVGLGYSGLFVVIPAGIGAFLGSVLLPKMIASKIRKKDIIEKGLLVSGIALLIMALGVSFIPVVFRVIATIVLVFMVGFGYILASIPTLTYLQEVTPVNIRGRVFGNLWFLVTILTLFPVLFSGLFTEIFGIKSLILLMGVSILVIYYFAKLRGQKIIEEHF